MKGFYKCMTDPQRIRILSLLKDGPLCVCHLSEILGMDQVRLSKQLRYLKDQGVATAERSAQWMIYSLSEPAKALLSANLACIGSLEPDELPLADDSKRREKLSERIAKGDSVCSNEVRELIASKRPLARS